MNDKELHDKVHAAMYALMKEKGVASSVEVLIAIGAHPKRTTKIGVSDVHPV